MNTYINYTLLIILDDLGMTIYVVMENHHLSSHLFVFNIMHIFFVGVMYSLPINPLINLL